MLFGASLKRAYERHMKGRLPLLIFPHEASLVLHFLHSSPLSSSCFLCLFFHSVILSFLSPSAFVLSPLFGFFFVGESRSCQIFKASPRALFLVHLRVLMSLEQHTQPTNLQRCPAGILHDGLMCLCCCCYC